LVKHCLRAVVLAALFSGCAIAVPDERFTLQPCEVPNVEGPARCGRYEVYEDRSARSGRRISLNVVVVPALGAAPAADPVFWLEGGPGGAAVQSAAVVSGRYLRALRQDRDLVFVDQRGTGKSNPLDCDDIGDDPANLEAFFGPLLPPALIRACREKLEKIANLKLYTTPIAMDDLDDVRAALGYKTINLAGASYGTIAAQVYMRQHPERVRAAFLAGVATPGFKLPLPFARAAQHALDLLFEDCAADEECRAAFPRVREEFAAVLARFDRGPLAVKVIDPVTQQTREVRLERESYVERLRLMLYSTHAARFVPAVVHRAFLGDFVPFQAMAVRFNLGSGALSRGMYLTVTCAEAAPFITELEIAAETRGTFLGERRVRAHLGACREWVRADVPWKFTDALTSDSPVVLLSGELDGATPPWFAEAAMRGLPNGRQITARYAGHQIDGPCVWDIISSFIRSASVQSPDVSCVAALRRPRFATDVP
jgi:pimeloyl-ACP methyl ester carboxylesterase